MILRKKKKKDLIFFREVFGLQQNWAEGTRFPTSSLLPPFTCTASPLSAAATQEHICYSQWTVDTSSAPRAHSWCCAFCGSGHMYDGTAPTITGYFLCTKVLHTLPTHLHSLQPLAATNLFTDSILLSFPECDIVGITQYVAFSNCLLSFSELFFLARLTVHLFSDPLILTIQLT